MTWVMAAPTAKRLFPSQLSGKTWNHRVAKRNSRSELATSPLTGALERRNGSGRAWHQSARLPPRHRLGPAVASFRISPTRGQRTRGGPAQPTDPSHEVTAIRIDTEV